MATQKFNDSGIPTITSLDDTDYMNPVTAAAGDIQKITVANFKASFGLPLTYVALLNQASTAAPVATVLNNATAATVTLARSSNGTYTATASAPVFTLNKTAVYITSHFHGIEVSALAVSTTVINIYTTNSSGSLIDDAMQNTTFKIEIWP